MFEFRACPHSHFHLVFVPKANPLLESFGADVNFQGRAVRMASQELRITEEWIRERLNLRIDCLGE